MDPGRRAGGHGGGDGPTRPTAVLLIAVLAALVLAGCSAMDGDGGAGGDGGEAQTHDVAATGSFTFDPGRITIEVGDTVRWTVTGGSAHTVTSTSVPDGASSFDSGNLDPGETFEVTFDAPGTYDYRCEYHSSASGDGFSGMVGTVEVVQ